MSSETLKVKNSSALASKKDPANRLWAIGFQLFKFFASLRLAIFVLVSLMVVFAAGTFVESAFGTETASLLIYQSPWFALILFFLGTNVTAAALDRLPWKKKHTGFVITHIGIILILAGSFISQAFMIDGQMAIQEKSTEHRITLNEPVLFLYSESENKEWRLPFKKFPFAWNGRKELKAVQDANNFPFQVSLLNYYPKARIKEELIQASSGPAALKVTLHNSFVNQSEWLVEEDPQKSQIQMGPAKIRFAGERLAETKEKITGAGHLEFQFPEKTIPISLDPARKLPAQFSLEGTDYQVTLVRLLKNAVVFNNQLTDESEKEPEQNKADISSWKNPAVELLLEGKGVKEKHTVFARFPDFPTQHGMKPSQTGARILFRLPGGGSRGQSHELRFVRDGDGLLYQIQTGLEVKTGKVALGEQVPTGWMDLVFRVDAFYPHAGWDRNVLPEPNTTKKDDAVSTLQLELSHAGGKQEIWLRQGTPEKMEFQGKNYMILYGEKRIPLAFRLGLEDFRIEQYPGTQNPASFESDVMLRDDLRGIQRQVTISMNKPLIHQGFRIYQSGYSQAEGEPDVSIFTVGKDPGVPVKYLGAIVMVAGMIIMFWMRRFSTSGEKAV